MLQLKETILHPYVNLIKAQQLPLRLVQQVKLGTELRALHQLQRQPAQAGNTGVELLV